MERTNSGEAMLISLELNEVNFETLEDYIKEGKLQNFSKLFAKHGFITTSSEKKYEHLEPWIQWVTAHTGLEYQDHKVFRLGDIVKTDYKQIWEALEERGVTVGAVSPMNANNSAKNPEYFIPDPWTDAAVTGGWLAKRFYEALSQAVNDNARGKITVRSMLYLALSAMRYARPINYLRYLKLASQTKQKKWAKALFLDLLLADMFIGLQKAKRPQFSTLFLNAAAHIQHHYIYASKHYHGDRSNPEWYINKDHDPIFEVYNLYDKIIGQIIKAFPKARLQLLTGLHQTAYSDTTFYWRLKNHSAFLKGLGLSDFEVQPRMSRDFLMVCKSPEAAVAAGHKLSSIFAQNGDRIFSVDVRGHDLFAELTYEHDVTADFTYVVGNEPRSDLYDYVSLVAIKNGEHDGTGYYLDTKMPIKAQKAKQIALKDVFAINLNAFPV